MPHTKKILYIDLDNTLVDFQSGIDHLTDNIREEFENELETVRHLHPVDGTAEERDGLARQGSAGSGAPRNGGRPCHVHG